MNVQTTARAIVCSDQPTFTSLRITWVDHKRIKLRESSHTQEALYVSHQDDFYESLKNSLDEFYLTLLDSSR